MSTKRPPTVAELQELGKRYTAEADRVTVLLNDPAQRVAREGERDAVFARRARYSIMADKTLAGLRAWVGEDDDWLFEDEFLSADGWERCEGGWRAPPSS